jgi:S1-C subfamily serine protease
MIFELIAVRSRLNFLLGLFVFMLYSQLVVASERYSGSVVQVRVTTYSYSFESPWQKSSGEKFSGSAVLMDGGKLLTNAHVIENAIRLEVRHNNSGEWYRATVEHVSEAVDLALITVNDPEFYQEGISVELSTDIQPGSEVSVVGFPEGGDSVSITKGVLSRTEETQYSYSGMHHLTHQIDAAVNYGNSGGAVFHQDSLIGISFQSIDEAENTAYAIPTQVITQFLDDAGDGYIDGIPQLPFIYTNIVNENLKAYLTLDDSEGVYVTSVVGDEQRQCAMQGDVVVAVDGIPINSSGRINLDTLGAISIDYLATTKQLGDSVSLQLLRDGKTVVSKCELQMAWRHVWTTTSIRYNYRPEWIEVGGIIMISLSNELFFRLDEEELTLDSLGTKLRYELQQGKVDSPHQGILVINILDHDANQGYDFRWELLTGVNGVPVYNIKQLRDVVNGKSAAWVKLEFYGGDIAVFKQSELAGISAELNSEYGL